MDELEALDVYRFDDAYFAALARAGRTTSSAWTTSMASPPRCCGSWIGTPPGTTWAARRDEPSPVVGAMNLCTAAGLAEAGRRGLALGVLGGGRGTGEDDPLFAFKRQMATRVLMRPVFAS